MEMLDEINPCRAVQKELVKLPGFRFYPTEEELVGFYLKNSAQSNHQLDLNRIIPMVDLYQYDPWELPGLTHDVGERQWFFFVPRYHKKCARPNRLAVSGYWKATGADKAVRNELHQCIGLKKFLVFYIGKNPCGVKTDWIMNEYRMPDMSSSASTKKLDIVLCRIYRKAATHKSMEERMKPVNIEPVVSGDEYEEKSHSITHNASCQSNPITEAEVSRLHCPNQGEVWKDEASLFECLEPIISHEETMILETPKAYKPLQLELPSLSMDFLLSPQIATPYSLLSTPSPFQIPL